jgi:LysR family transcriptional regulator (chromosome initiation inhibitor)
MIDYKLLEALAAVVEEGGFERAARVLLLTQSAVSQRLRQLEDRSGQLLLTRTTPPQATSAGRLLLKHYRQVKMLEAGLAADLSGSAQQHPQLMAIGINADSLDYWFIDAVAPLLEQMCLRLDLRVADQEQTLKYLRAGEVVGCISAVSKPLQGCRVEPLGRMTYRLLATPAFRDRWFAEGLTADALKQAPAVIYDRNDSLHQQFLTQYVSTDSCPVPAHYIPASVQFYQVIAAGYCYGMLPDWQSRVLLAQGGLCELIPGAMVSVDLFWHCWNLGAKPLEQLTAQLLAGAREFLVKKTISLS